MLCNPLLIKRHKQNKSTTLKLNVQRREQAWDQLFQTQVKLGSGKFTFKAGGIMFLKINLESHAYL